MKRVLLTLVVLSFSFAHAQNATADKSVPTPSTGVEAGRPSKEQREANKTEMQGERDAVVSACAEESKAGGCDEKVVGKGLLKCIHSHKKASKDFKVSEGCKTALKALKEERKRVRGK